MRFSERSSVDLLVEFKDQNKAPVVPTSANYRIDDGNGTSILGVTAIGGLAESVTLLITPAQNTITNPADQTQQRIVTIEFDFGSRHGGNQYKYDIEQLPA